MEICFPINGQMICVTVPWYLPPWWPHPPQPDPGPWMKVDGDPPPWLQDLRVLATVAGLTAIASPQITDQLNAVVRQATEVVMAALPAGAELELAEIAAPEVG